MFRLISKNILLLSIVNLFFLAACAPVKANAPPTLAPTLPIV